MKILAAIVSASLSLTAAAQSPLAMKLSGLTAGFPGRVGIAVEDRGVVTAINGNAGFPLQSVCKLIEAAAVLDKLDHHKFELQDKIYLRRINLSVYHQPLAALVTAKGYTTTLGDLIRRAVVESDNAAGDVLFAKAGGAVGVGRFLKSKGISGVRIDRAERDLQTANVGLKFQPPFVDQSVFDKAIAAVPKATHDAAWKAALSEKRDSATPAGMCALLRQLADGMLLSKISTEYLLGAMHDAKTGPDRLAAGLAPGWSLSHKTGTAGRWNGIDGATNDEGILTAPDGSQIILAVFVSGSSATDARIVALIASVARTVIAAHGQ